MSDKCKFCGLPTNTFVPGGYSENFCSKECETDYREREIIQRMGDI